MSYRREDWGSIRGTNGHRSSPGAHPHQEHQRPARPSTRPTAVMTDFSPRPRVNQRDRPAATPDMTGSARPISALHQDDRRACAGLIEDDDGAVGRGHRAGLDAAHVPGLSQLAGSIRHSASQWCPSRSVKPR